MPRASDFSEADLNALLAAPKDGGGHTSQWSPAVAGDGSLIASTLQFGVSVHGHDLVVRAEWKGERERHIFLQFPHDNARLARLCATKCHDGVAHWHYLEQIRKIAERKEEIENPPDDMDALLNTFIGGMQVQNVVIQGTFQP